MKTKKDDPLAQELCKNGFHWCKKDERYEGNFKLGSLKTHQALSFLDDKFRWNTQNQEYLPRT